MYDNRQEKRSEKSPDFRCADEACVGDKGNRSAVWGRKPGGKGKPAKPSGAPGGTQKTPQPSGRPPAQSMGQPAASGGVLYMAGAVLAAEAWRQGLVNQVNVTGLAVAYAKDIEAASKGLKAHLAHDFLVGEEQAEPVGAEDGGL